VIVRRRPTSVPSSTPSIAACQGPWGAPLCLHVVAEDEYYEITLTDWGGGGTGGLAYTRRLAGVGCDVNAECIDTSSSFECECLDGYEGDGITCDAIPG
jgi:hypothetical protein